MQNHKIKSLFFILFLLFGYHFSFGQVRVSFTPRASQYSPDNHMYYLKGDYQLIGNTNLTLVNYGTATGNGNVNMQYVDIDDDPITINSSMAELTFRSENGSVPHCSDIVYAGLYWTGRAANADNGPFSWVIGGSENNIVYQSGGSPVGCYTLVISSSGSSQSNIVTYEFIPNNGGTPITFRYYGDRNSNFSLTIQVGSGTPTQYTDVTFPNAPTGGNTRNRTVTFNSPFRLNTGDCTIFISSLTKRTASGTSTNLYATTVSGTIGSETTTVSGGQIQGYNVTITSTGTGSSNATTYTLVKGSETVTFNFNGATYSCGFLGWSTCDNHLLTVTRNGVTTDLTSAASFTGTKDNNTSPRTATFGTPYELEPGVFITRLNKISNNLTSGNTGNFYITHGIETDPVMLQKNKIFFKHESEDNYQPFFASAQDIWYPSDQDKYMYVAYKEVTDYVKAHGLGDYYVANMALVEGNGGGTGYFGGWGLVVIYQNSLMNWRNITVFDGYAHVDVNNTNVVVNIEGFHTIQTGNVHLKLGVMAGEGDADIDGDFLQIRDQTNSYIYLNHGANSANDFFNSSIYTGGNARNPNLINSTGVDISMFEVDNPNNSVITNDQTSASFRLGSTQDAYVIFALIMGVDAYVPALDGLNVVSEINNISISDTVSTITVHPGDTVEYKLEVRNLGLESVVNAHVTIPIPYTSEYFSSYTVYTNGVTGTVNYDPTEGAGGTILWDIDEVPPGTIHDVYATLYYKLIITDDCDILSGSNCDLYNNTYGEISGQGEVSAIPFAHLNFIRGYHYEGDCIGEPIYGSVEMVIDATDYIENNCPIVEDPVIRTFPYCNITGSIPFYDVSGFFPAGSRYYNQYNPLLENPTEGATEYTYETGFPNLFGTHTYYAVFPEEGCYARFVIEGLSFTDTPTVSISHYYYCQGDEAIPLSATPSSPSHRVYYYTQASGGAASTVLVPATNVVGTRQYYAVEALSNGCVSTNRVPITVTTRENPAVTLTSDAPNNTICDGATATLTANVENGKPFKFAWYDADPATNPPLANQTNNTYSTLDSGSFWVKVTDSITDCYTIAGPLSITVNTQPVLSQDSLTRCGGATDTIQITVPGKTDGATASILNGTLGTVTLDNNSLIISTNYISADNSTTITYTDGNNCAASLNLTVKTTPILSLPADFAVCQNSGDQVITPTITNIGDDTLTLYSWNGGAYQRDTTTYTLSTAQVGVQTVTLIVKNENGCFSDPATVTMTVQALPEITLSPYSSGSFSDSGDTIYICEHEKLVLKASPLGSSHTWYYPTGTTTTTDSLTINNIPLTQSGWFKVVVNQPGCTASDSVYLYICPIPKEPNFILKVMRGSDTIRDINKYNNPVIDTIPYSSSIHGILYFPPNANNQNYVYRTFTAMNNYWTSWKTIRPDTTIIVPNDLLISGFNGIMVKYEESCDLDCGPMVYFEYMAYLRLMDSTLHYTPSLNEIFVCQNEDSLYLYNIYCPSFHPLVGHFIFRYDYINGETGIAYYQSAWDTLAYGPEDYIFLIDENGDTIFNVIAETPRLSTNNAPNQIATQPTDLIAISLRITCYSMVTNEHGDTTYIQTLSPITQHVWQISFPMPTLYPIYDNVVCKNSSSIITYHTDSVMPSGYHPISWISMHWRHNGTENYTRLGTVDTFDLFDFEAVFEDGYDYPRAIRYSNFIDYDTFFYAVEFLPKYSTCPTLRDTFFIVARDSAPLPIVTTPQYTCDSIYEILVDSIPPGFVVNWRLDTTLSCPADSGCYVVPLTRGETKWRYVNLRYPNPAYCESAYVPVQVTRYGDISAGSIETGGDTLCINTAASEIISLTNAVPAKGNIRYQWLVNDSAITGTNHATFTPSEAFTGAAGVYYFTRQAQDECARGWENSLGVYELAITTPSSLVSQNAEDKVVCYGAAITPITYYDTLGSITPGLERLHWIGTADSTTPPAGIIVNNLNNPYAPITITGSPTESGQFSSILYIPNPEACGGGAFLTDTVNYTVHPELNGGRIEPVIQYAATIFPLIDMENALSPSGGIGTPTYRWQYSYDSITYTDILYANMLTYNYSMSFNTDFVLRRVYTNQCGTAFSNLANVYFVKAVVEEFAVTTHGRILSADGAFVDESGEIQIFPALTQFGEILRYTPYVMTNGVSQLGTTTAKLTGGILFTGYSIITEKGFEISTDSSFTEANTTRYDNVTNVLLVTNLFTYNLTGLQSETEYYVRAYATNAQGTGYGQVIRFVTK